MIEITEEMVEAVAEALYHKHWKHVPGEISLKRDSPREQQHWNAVARAALASALPLIEAALVAIREGQRP